MVLTGSVNCDHSEFYAYDGSPGTLVQPCSNGLVEGVVTASSAAGAPGVLSGQASLQFAGLGGLPGELYSANAVVTYTDTLSFNVTGANPGESVRLTIHSAISGNPSASVSNPTSGFAVASGKLDVTLSPAGSLFPANLVTQTHQPDFGTPTRSRTFTIQDGLDYFLTLRLVATATVNNGSGVGTGMADADFSSTAGITLFEVTALDGVTPLSFSFSSQDGFTLYNPVPEGSTAALLGCALAFGVLRFRRLARPAAS